MDDFSKSPLRPCARCSLGLVGRFCSVSPMYTLPHSQGIRHTVAGIRFILLCVEKSLKFVGS